MGKIAKLHPEKTPEDIMVIEAILSKFPDIEERLENVAEQVEKKGVLLHYKNGDDLENDIEEYFTKRNKTPLEPPTLAGLAGHLGITRQTLLAYGQNHIYSYYIEKAKNRIEAIVAGGALVKAFDSSFSKFTLKANHGREDIQKIEKTTTETKAYKIEIIQPAIVAPEPTPPTSYIIGETPKAATVIGEEEKEERGDRVPNTNNKQHNTPLAQAIKAKKQKALNNNQTTNKQQQQQQQPNNN